MEPKGTPFFPAIFFSVHLSSGDSRGPCSSMWAGGGLLRVLMIAGEEKELQELHELRRPRLNRKESKTGKGLELLCPPDDGTIAPGVLTRLDSPGAIPFSEKFPIPFPFPDRGGRQGVFG